MKASLKFREDQKPLGRAKVPISILGLPFISGISAGEKSDLRLDLVTAFESGPSLSASYRPNEPSNPFLVSLKIGVGNLGSPFGAPMSMTTEFGFGGGNTNPSFTILFKPRLGDFSFKKLVKSPEKRAPTVGSESDGEGAAVWVEKEKVHGFPATGIAGGKWGIGDLLTGVEVTARSVLPMKNRAAVRFKWGVRVPADLRSAFTEDGSPGRISFSKLPLLVMSKISIEHVAGDDGLEGKKKQKGRDDVGKGISDMAEACMEVKRQLEAIQAENGNLRRAVEELRGSVSAAGVSDVIREGVKKQMSAPVGKPLPEVSRRAGATAGKAKEDVNEELKKALIGATGGAGK